jgi:Concanavalin A-like lectin/glucanases superfamily/Secretion system C-terminal sorting domain
LRIINIPFGDQLLDDEVIYDLNPYAFGTQVGFTEDRAGNANCAYQFGGYNYGYLKLPALEVYDFLPLTGFSISLWYKGGSAEAGDFEGLVQHGETYWYDNPNRQDYHLALYDLNKPLFLSIWYELNDGTLMEDTTTWRHLVGVYNNQYVKFYLNGELINEDQIDDDLYDYPYANEAEELVIGKGFHGAMDDLEIYDFALSTEEVDFLFSNDANCSEATGVNDLYGDNEILNLYPNPSNGELNINTKNLQEAFQVQIFDAIGKLVYDSSFSTNIDISNRQLNGVYLVSVFYRDGSIIKKSIVLNSNKN